MYFFRSINYVIQKLYCSNRIFHTERRWDNTVYMVFKTGFNPYKYHHHRAVSTLKRSSAKMHQLSSWMEKPEPRKPSDKEQSDHHKSSVLRFYGIWNDEANLYGDKRYFALHYFLEDGTIELIEQYPNNSGRMPCHFFLNRARVPKALQPMALIGKSQVGDMPQDCWTDRDLHVGAEIDIYGRKVFLYDCDDQTRRYYKTKYGIDNCPINVNEPYKTTSPLEISFKFTEIGGDLDTITTKAQLPQFDRKGTEIYQLTFFAKVDDPVDRNRTFIISYFLTDDTIEIFEPIRNNSGFRSGVVLNRQKFKKGDEYDPATCQPCYWDLLELYVGRGLPLFRHTLRICDADEFSYTYMENRPQLFPKSNIKVIMEKIRPQLAGRKEAVKKMFEDKDSQCTNTVHPEDFRSIFRQLMPDQDCMTDHEMITVVRFYGNRNGPNMFLEQLVTLARSLLQKVGYKMQEQTMQALVNTDKDQTGLLTPQEIYSTLRGCHLPLEPELLHNIITRMPAKEHRYINYKDLVHALAWEVQVGALDHPDRFRYDCRLISELVHGITEVRYKDFLTAAGVLSGPSP